MGIAQLQRALNQVIVIGCGVNRLYIVSCNVFFSLIYHTYTSRIGFIPARFFIAQNLTYNFF